MADVVPVLNVSELPAGTKKAVSVSGKRIMVVNADGHYFAMDDAGSHKGCDLSEEGMVDGNTLTCGCHGSQFDLSSGAVLAPPAVTPMKIYHVKVEGDKIFVAL